MIDTKLYPYEENPTCPKCRAINLNNADVDQGYDLIVQASDNNKHKVAFFRRALLLRRKADRRGTQSPDTRRHGRGHGQVQLRGCDGRTPAPALRQLPLWLVVRHSRRGSKDEGGRGQLTWLTTTSIARIVVSSTRRRRGTAVRVVDGKTRSCFSIARTMTSDSKRRSMIIEACDGMCGVNQPESTLIWVGDRAQSLSTHDAHRGLPRPATAG
jgi:hypothetical protein